MKKLAETEEPYAAAPLAARVVQVEVPVVGIAIEIGHVAVPVRIHPDGPIKHTRYHPEHHSLNTL
ncbi:MAG: hypothetical protein A2534_00095 [Candidatus Magasanikbacteria bacterium RIFOXYD2_FULL_39_9]|nr:MAG: hypothetical protein A2534_00095 [Candidatus Magasanikbacteria bacterium RIFOXYD2_FULL_39_9]